MLSFPLVAEALTGLIYHRPSGENSGVCSLHTLRDIIILQNENKMKACLGKNLKISLPKAYQNCKAKIKCVICGEGHSHKGCANREKKQPKCANCKGPHVASYKGCPAYKVQAFHQHVVDNQKSYASILKQNLALPPQPKGDTVSFTADQLVKFVTTVGIQVAQPQVCYTNAPKNAVDKTSSLCRRVSKAAKSQLEISISGNTLFDAIGCIRAPVPPASKIPVIIPEPFRFSAFSKPLATKPSTILNSLSPPVFTNKTVPKQPNSSK